MTQIHRLSPAEALAVLGSSARGLSAAEAARRLAQYGPNRIRRAARDPAVLRFGRELFRFFSIILWLAAGLAFLAAWADPGEGMAQVGAAVVAVIVVSALFSFWQEDRIARMLSALQELLPAQARAMRDGTVALLAVDRLVPGDVILLAPGDRVPADCRLLEAFGVRVSMATITGEAFPQGRDAEPAQTDEPLACRNLLLAGTSLLAGEGRALVFATGAETQFGRIAHLAQTSRDAPSPLRRDLARLSRLIAIMAVALGVLFFAVAGWIGVPLWRDLVFAIGIIVAMVPEGLLPTLTLSLVLAAQRMARRKVLIRNLTSVETLGSATVICTDKTGTLTENRMEVRDIFLGGHCRQLDAIGDASALVSGHPDFFRCAWYCHDLTEQPGAATAPTAGDPIELALLEMHRRIATPPPAAVRLDGMPFDSVRMRQTVVVATADGARLFAKGACEPILARCGSIAHADGARPLDATAREQVLAAQDAMATRGLRVLALASRDLPADWAHDGLERDLVFQGLVGLRDPPRREVARAIATCHEAGVKVVMVTGDHPGTALAIAREIGLVRGEGATVVTGERLSSLSNEALSDLLERPDLLFARVAAADKMRIVEALKAKGEVVAVTGDGVNDAPALKAAHIGVAMGRSGTDVAREAADMVLLDDNFAGIVAAIEEGRAVFQNIRKFLTYVLVHNVAELVPYLAFALFPVPLALTPIQILLIDMGSDSLTGLGLGIERPDPAEMRRPPRPQHEPLLTWAVGMRAYLVLGPIEAAAGMAAFFFVLMQGAWTYGDRLAWNDPLYLRATTACLSAIIVLQIVNVFLCRSATRSAFARPLAINPLIRAGVALEISLLLAANYLPPVNTLLGTLPALATIAPLLAPFVIAMVAADGLLKSCARRPRSGRVPGPVSAAP